MKGKKSKMIEILWFVVILGLFILSIKMVRSGELQEQIAGFGMLAPIVLVILKASTLIIAPLGGTPLYLLAGALFGNISGFLLCFLADAIGSAGCFLISRKFGDRLVRSLAGENFFQQIKKFANILGSAKSFLKARIAVFNIPELAAYAAGLSPINFWKFMSIQMPFFIPGSFVLVFFGSQVATLSAKYFFIFPLVLALIAFTGFWALYKDYESRDEILRDENQERM